MEHKKSSNDLYSNSPVISDMIIINLISNKYKGDIYMNESVIVFGASGHAKVAIDILNYTGYDVVGVFDDNTEIHGTTILNVPVIGGTEKLKEQLDNGVMNAFVAIGNNKVRVQIGKKLKDMGFKLITAIHHSAILSDTVRVGDGSMVAAGAVINPDSKIGKYVIINTSSTVDHDCIISDGVHISPGANLAGNVSVGENTHIGIGSSVIQGIDIAKDSIVGAGSVVVRDIEANVTAYGNPARVKKIGIKQ